MRNPLRSEAEAYRFLLLTIAYFAAIVLASLAGNRWWGIGVFVLLTAAGAWWFLQREGERPVPRVIPGRESPAGMRRILVIANETVGGQRLRQTLQEKTADANAEVFVVSPALNSPLRHWVSDEDNARAAAQQRLDVSLDRLAGDGLRARGEVGDGDPLQALEDALRKFGADEIVISTHPPGKSHWLEQNLVEQARERFDLPVTHVVVDLEAEA
jgi:hypothetical protein